MIVLQLITSFITLMSVRMAGKGDQRFNYLGLGNQALWVIVILQSKTYGILLLTSAMVFQYSQNIWRWKRRERANVGVA